MKRLLQLPSEQGTVLVEVSIPGEDIQPVVSLEDAVAVATSTLEQSFRTLVAVAGSFERALSPLGPALQIAELELGLQFTAKGSIYVVESQAQAVFKAKLVLKPQGTSPQA